MEKNLHILLCEDEESLGMLVREYLEAKGYNAELFLDGEAGYRAFMKKKYDMCLLDVMMPKMDGFALAKEIRLVNSEVPIIFLTALSDEEDKLLGYELGADDYVTKPFSLAVLHAKMTALINRSRGNVRQTDRLTAGEITMQLSSQKVFVSGEAVSLTPKEYALLLCLMRNRGNVMSREQLLIKCWGYDYDGEARAVDTHIRRLRDKLGTAAGYVKTVIKAGYKLEV